MNLGVDLAHPDAVLVWSDERRRGMAVAVHRRRVVSSRVCSIGLRGGAKLDSGIWLCGIGGAPIGGWHRAASGRSSGQGQGERAELNAAARCRKLRRDEDKAKTPVRREGRV